MNKFWQAILDIFTDKHRVKERAPDQLDGYEENLEFQDYKALVELNRQGNPAWLAVKDATKRKFTDMVFGALCAENAGDYNLAMKLLGKANVYYVMAMQQELPDVKYNELFDKITAPKEKRKRPDGEEENEPEL